MLQVIKDPANLHEGHIYRNGKGDKIGMGYMKHGQ